MQAKYTSTTNQFRSIQFRLPAAEGAADAVLYVSPFPGGVGALEANLDRWTSEVGMTTPASQLPGDQRWTEDVRDFVVTTIYVKGPLKASMGMATDTPTIEDGALYAAFIEKVGAPSVWTVKARGPAATMAKHEAAIRAFMKGL